MEEKEKIIKYWFIEQKQKILIVLLTNRKIYKGRVGRGDMQLALQKEIGNGKIPESFFPIPYSYIRRVEHVVNGKVIKIQIGKRDEIECKVEPQNVKNEIFSFLKDNLTNVDYQFEDRNWLKSIKKPLIAFVAINLWFFWALYLARMIEDGQYIGDQLILVLIVAGLGSGLIITLLVLFNILIFTQIYFKLKKLPETHILLFKKGVNYELKAG